MTEEQTKKERIEKYAVKMQKCAYDSILANDPEAGHMEADNILCDLLRELGYEKVVRIYEKIGKWYS